MCLELLHVGRRFGGLKALTDVSMRVKPARVTGLIGPNGAGKTTLVNIISGLLYPTSGRISFEGADISRLQPYEVARIGIARTFQTVRLLERETVRDNILVGFDRRMKSGAFARLLGLPVFRREMAHVRARIDGLLEEFGLADLAQVAAGEISYGHRRRVEIVRALALSPRLLLLDEPAAGLNDTEAETLARSIRGIASDGVAVLLIEHNMQMVMTLCDELHVLNSGTIIASGDPTAVRNNPSVVTAYLGEQG